MKLLSPQPRRGRHQGGFLVIALLAIISIMLIYIAANLHVLAKHLESLRQSPDLKGFENLIPSK